MQSTARTQLMTREFGDQDAGPGRFAPPRHYDAIGCQELPGLTCRSSLSPRLGVTYDPLGTAKTAIKASFGRYVQPETTGFISNYNPTFQTSERRTWSDTNKDNIAQDSEIGPSPDANFGSLAGRRPDPDYQREYYTQYSVGVQHEVIRSMSVNAAWYRRTAGNLPYSDNQAYGLSDWTPVNVISPLNGEVITAYNLNRNKFGLPQDIIDFNSKDSSTRRNVTRYASGTLVIPNMTNPSLTINLVAPNAQYLPRFNQLDLGGKRAFRFGNGREVQSQVDVFNALNSNVVLTQNQTFGSSLGQPLSILTPRLARLAAQIKF